jgi:hypothetical protein
MMNRGALPAMARPNGVLVEYRDFREITLTAAERPA